MDPAAEVEHGRGRGATAPWRIPLLGWKDIVWRTYRAWQRHRLPSVAGGVAFYLLLAIFPALAAFVSIYGLFSDVNSVTRELERLAVILPREAVGLIGDELLTLSSRPQTTLGAAFAVSLLASLWSANAGMKALFDGLNVAYGETEKRPYLRRTLITYATTLSATALVAASAALTVGPPALLRALGFHGGWWAPVRWLVVYLLAAQAFTLAYRVGPSREPARWSWVYCGGAAAAFLWLVGSLGFSLYLDNFRTLGATYGSLSAVIALMLWLWFSTMVVLVGAEFSAQVEHQTAVDTTTGAPKPLGQRGAVMADGVGKPFTTSPKEAGNWLLEFLGRQVAYVARVLGARRGQAG